MKLKTEYEYVEIGDEITAVPVGDNSFKGVLVVNETMRDVMKLLKEETTEDVIINAICEMYNSDRDTIAGDVHSILQQLAGDNLIK